MLPRLVLVADGFTRPDRAERAFDAVAAGVPWIHLRDHAAEADFFGSAAQTFVDRLRAVAPAVKLSVNGRLDVAEALGVGFHTGRHGPAVAEARQQLGPGVPLGFSAHDDHEARAALAAGADYVFYSPIFPTASKPGHAGVGPEALAAVCRAVAPAPVFALGGITAARVGICRAAGAYGVAALSGLLGAPDVAATAQDFLAEIDPPNPQSALRNPQ